MSHCSSLAVLPLVLGLALSAGSALAGDLVDQIVAVVNKDVVLQSELDEAVEYTASLELQGLEGEVKTAALVKIKTELLDSLISTRLMEQAMDRSDISVSDHDLEAAISDIASQNNIDVEKLYSEIAKQGMDKESYRAEMRSQLRQYQFMNMEIRSRVQVSDEDIRSAYRQANANHSPDMAFQLQRILLSYTKGSPETIRAEAELLLEELRGGKDFATVAVARSDDPSTAEKGGAAGLFRPSELSGAFAGALDGAQVGDIVLVDLPTGVFILRVDGLVDTAIQNYDSVRADIARMLHDKGMDRELALWTQEERRRSHIETFL
jgi:peptidyl-prolyl cis-trans isomerase SurA